MKHLILLFLIFTMGVAGFAQHNNSELPTSVNTDGAAPDASAMFDVKSTAKGVLIPRMTSAQRNAISTPADGLLVFDTDRGQFWFFEGGAWKALDTSGGPYVVQGQAVTGFESNGNANDGFQASSNTDDGFFASSNSGDGFYAWNNSGDGFESSSNAEDGFEANNNTDDGFYASSNMDDGFVAWNNTGDGFKSISNVENGFEAINNTDDGFFASSNTDVGFHSWSNSGDGILSNSNAGDGIYSLNNTGSAGYFSGDVTVTGALSKGSGTFKIDHPLDPENKYLYHSFVESPDMMNVYNGNVILDANGEAVVTMDDWFQPLNREFRYQLTCIGGFAPVYISEKMNNNQFKIAGGTAGLEVSWQVTGIRQDPYAEQNRVVVEEEKPVEFRGYYLHPEVYGKSFEQSVDFVKLGHKTLDALREELERENAAQQVEMERKVMDESVREEGRP